jgi:hypothetical protein
MSQSAMIRGSLRFGALFQIMPSTVDAQILPHRNGLKNARLGAIEGWFIFHPVASLR